MDQLMTYPPLTQWPLKISTSSPAALHLYAYGTMDEFWYINAPACMGFGGNIGDILYVFLSFFIKQDQNNAHRNKTDVPIGVKWHKIHRSP